MPKIKQDLDPLSKISHDFSQLGLAFRKMADSVSVLSRRIDSLQKTTSLVYQDREILEDIKGDMRRIEDVLLSNRKHQDMATQDLKADVQEVHEKVEKTKKDVINKVEDVKDTFEENTSELIEEVSKKKELFKKHFWNKIPHVFRG